MRITVRVRYLYEIVRHLYEIVRYLYEIVRYLCEIVRYLYEIVWYLYEILQCLYEMYSSPQSWALCLCVFLFSALCLVSLWVIWWCK